MQTDPHSLAELQLIEPNGGGSIITLIDRTATPAGRARLAALLTSPLRSADAIRGRQSTLRYIAQRHDAFDLSTVAPAIAATRAYLDSRWQELSEDPVQCATTAPS